MTVAQIVAGLERIPLLSVGELSASLDEMPTAGGFYAWWTTPGAIPDLPATLHPSQSLELLYVGIAPNGPGSKSSLRKRLRTHTKANVGSSTFRFDLAALLYLCEHWKPTWTDRPFLTRSDLDALATWQVKHLRAQWAVVPEPWTLEPDVVAAMHPPLNRHHNESHAFHAAMGLAREAFRDAARAGA